MIEELTFITGNQNKADFLAKYLGLPVSHRKLDLDEIQSLDIHEVVEHKAREAYRLLGTPVIVEDASLTIQAMGRLPGPFIKWFLEDLGLQGLIDHANVNPDRTAVGHVCYGLYDGTEVRFFDGEMHGRIAEDISTETNGFSFGFDAIFINEGFDVPRTEMSEADYARTSYRTMALHGLREALS